MMFAFIPAARQSRNAVLVVILCKMMRYHMHLRKWALMMVLVPPFGTMTTRWNRKYSRFN